MAGGSGNRATNPLMATATTAATAAFARLDGAILFIGITPPLTDDAAELPKRQHRYRKRLRQVRSSRWISEL